MDFEWGLWQRWKKDVQIVHLTAEISGTSRALDPALMFLKDHFKADKFE